jgi:ERCC4-type nuclease
MDVAVTLDDREPPDVGRLLRAHPEVTKVTIRRLDAGDVVVGDVGIERKTSRDFVRSAMGRRGSDLRDQLRRLAAASEHPYLLVEGDLSDLDRAANSPASARGALASLLARTGIPVVPCGSREALVDLAVRIGRKHVERPGNRPMEPGSIPARSEPTAKRIYGCIEGIGPTLAARLHEAYPTVADLLDASIADIARLEGFGEGRARAVHEALRSPD